MKKNAYRCLIAASMILLQPNVIGYAAVPTVTENASAVSTVAEDNQQTESIENEDQNENQNAEEKNDISGNTTDDVRSEEDQNIENTTDENETLQSDKPAEQTQIQSNAVAKKENGSRITKAGGTHMKMVHGRKMRSLKSMV